jgi:asparagine synthase (glutamine-hydrolysing)
MEDDSALTPRLDRLLRSAVERNLIADVPVGAYLSGGLDSSLITAIAADLKRTPIHTFAAGFADSRANELPNARSIATRLKTTHHEVLVTPEDFMAEWGRLSWHRDAPVSEASDVAVYRLAQAAREHVGVVMSGEGSDELFAGYPKHLLARPTRWVGSIPYPPRIRATRWLRRHTSSRKLAVALSAIGERTYRDRIGGWFAPFTTEEAIHLLGQRPARVDVLSRTDLVTSPLATMLRYDLASWLPDNLLERGDRMSMAASLELRPPFLDAGVVSFALALPDQRKIRGRTGKWILRQVAKAYLPAEIISQKKVGFTVPLAQWFRGGLRDFAFDRLRSGTSLATQLFDKREVNRLLGGHHSGGFDYSGQLWTLVSLEMWYERFASSISVGRQ